MLLFRLEKSKRGLHPRSVGRRDSATDAATRVARNKYSSIYIVVAFVYTLGRHGWMLDGCARVRADDAPVGADDVGAVARR